MTCRVCSLRQVQVQSTSPYHRAPLPHQLHSWLGLSKVKLPVRGQSGMRALNQRRPRMPCSPVSISDSFPSPIPLAFSLWKQICWPSQSRKMKDNFCWPPVCSVRKVFKGLVFNKLLRGLGWRAFLKISYSAELLSWYKITGG